MPVYRLVIKRNGRLVGHFETTAASTLDDCIDIASRLPSQDGYRLDIQVADGERRLLESTPAGIRLLASEILFRALPEGLPRG
ncbi:cytoplasmic protein [Achromobacter denitrificans]